MFICKKCGQVPKKIKQQKVTVKIRTIKYLFRNMYVSRQIDSATGIPKLIPSAPKVVKETSGWEIVEQDIYCSKCAPEDIKPEVIGTVNKYIDRTVYVREKEKRGIFSKRRR